MAFSKVTGAGIATDTITAEDIAADAIGTAELANDVSISTSGNIATTGSGTLTVAGASTHTGTSQLTGQVTLGTGSGSSGSWSLPTSRGANDKYVLQINGTTGASTWAESLTAPELSSHSYDVSGSTDDGGINAYEAPYAYTGTTNQTTTISALSSTTGLKAGQYISGAGIPADTTIISVDTGASTMVISDAVTVAGTQTNIALKIQKTPGEKNGGKVTLTGTNFGVNVADISVAITNSNGGIIANASYLSGLSGGNTITAEWTGTEGTYSTDLTSSYDGKLYFKITKSGLASNVYDSNTTLTTDGSFTTLSTSSQTGGERSATPSATSLGTYGSGKIAGGDNDSNSKLLLDFDRGGGTDIEDSSNTNDIGVTAISSGHKVTANASAIIKASPFGDGKSAMYFGTNSGASDNQYLTIPQVSNSFAFGTGAFTIECWVMFLDDSTNDQSFIHTVAQGQTATDTQFNMIWNGNPSSRHKQIIFNSGTAAKHTGGTLMVKDRWYHVAVVRDGSNNLNIYIDGKKSGSTYTTSWDISSGHNLEIARGAANGGNAAKIYLDEVRICKGLAVYTGDFTVPTSRLSTTWSANPFGGSNTVVNSDASKVKLLIHSNQDHSGKSGISGQSFPFDIEAAGDGVYQRTETTARNGENASNWNSSAWFFDGGNGNLFDEGGGIDNNYADVCPTATSVMTIEFWMKTANTSSTEMYLIDAGSSGWNLRHTPSNGLWILFSNAFDANGQMSMGNHTVNDNAWHHIALTKSVDGSVKNRVKLYVDGVRKFENGSTNDSDSNAVWPTNTSFRLGGDTGYYDGYLDDMRFTKGLVVYTGDNTSSSNFTLPTGKLTTTWAANPYGTTGGSGTAVNSDASKVAFLLKSVDGNSGTEGFIDSTTIHTITPTGAKHTAKNSGIAPALAWPASGKATGSAGIYFDGDTSHDGDRINVSPSPVCMHTDAKNTTVEFWFYCTGSGHRMTLFRSEKFDASSIGKNFLFEINASGTMKGWLLDAKGYAHASSPYSVYTVANFQTTFPNNQWHHFAFTHTGSSGGVAKVYVNGKYVAPDAATGSLWTGRLINESGHDLCFGGGESGSDTNVGSFKGYMDGIRVSDSIRYTGTSTSEWGNYDQPTKTYGAWGSTTPDVGTITLVATGSGDYTWSEVAGGTALPGTLAVGSTAHSGSGDSRTHTATITGAFTSGVTSDTTTNGILLKAQNDADATKAITLGTAGGGYDGIGITQKSTGKPILFNARRYEGNGVTSRSITEFGFAPDLIWTKNRENGSDWHGLFDTIRGTGSVLAPNHESAEVTNSNPQPISSFDLDGFTCFLQNRVNENNKGIIAWAWKAGGPPVGNFPSSLTDGIGNGTLVSGSLGYSDIKAGSGLTVKQTVNTNTGFSITQWDGTSGSDNQHGGKIPHNLGSGVGFVIIKRVSGATQNWLAFHKDMGTTTVNSVAHPKYGLLNLNDAVSSGAEVITGTNVEGSGTGTNSPNMFAQNFYQYGTNDTGGGVNSKYIMYAWKPVAGLSAFGKYTGNGGSGENTHNGINAIGFKPRMVITKNLTEAEHWTCFDSIRGTIGRLYMNSVDAEVLTNNNTDTAPTFTDTGFKFASGVTSAYTNKNNIEYIYLAFA